MIKIDIVSKIRYNIPIEQLGACGVQEAAGCVWRGYWLHAQLAIELSNMLAGQQMVAKSMGNKRPPPKFNRKWLDRNIDQAIKNIIAREKINTSQYISRGLLQMQANWISEDRGSDFRRVIAR